MWGVRIFRKDEFCNKYWMGCSTLHPKNDMDVTVMKAISYHM